MAEFISIWIYFLSVEPTFYLTLFAIYWFETIAERSLRM